MAEGWCCSPSTRGVGPVERDWSGSQASRCGGEHDALTRRCWKARWRADHVRGGGALAREESEGERGSPCVTNRSEVCPATAKRGRSSEWEESTNGSRAGGERPRRSSELQWRRWCSARTERGRESEREGADGRKWQWRRRRALLVADQGASRSSHARHAAAEFCRHATAARRGHPSAWTRALVRGGGDALVG